MWSRRVVAIVALSLALLFGGCGADDEAIDVFAAASLADAFGEIASAYTEASGVEVRLNFAGSSSLREQILEGASVDVFASANPSIMDDVAVVRSDLGPRATMAMNELVLAVPTSNPGNVTSVEQLTDESLLVGLCAPAVPCGDLAVRYLDQVRVDASVDTLEPDVRFVVARLLDAELDAGMVYASDVVASVGGLEIVARAEPAVTTSYPIAVMDDDDDARAFVDFVLGPGQDILERWGFLAP